MTRIRFGIIGCGRIAQRHAECMAKLGEITAVCDIKIDRAQALAEKHRCRSYADPADFLRQESACDVVAVCTPNGTHAELTIAALRAHKHVICEKPMALTSQDCLEMIKEAEQANRTLFIVKQNRFNPPIIALKKALDMGRLGDITSLQLNCFWNRNEDYYLSSDWKGTRRLDGGTLYTQFSHFIDLILWLNGGVKTVSGVARNLQHGGLIEFEDVGVVALEFANGSLGTIHYNVNSFGKNMEGSITVFGKKGTVKVGGQYLNILEYQNIEGYKIPDIEEVRPANDYGFYQGSMSNHDKVYENVLDVLMNKGVISTTGVEGLQTVELIERIYRSINR